jgi:flagellar hook-associated protein 1 FlgK
MTNINGLLNMAGNALLAHQLAINVAGNNIANVNTPGYSRQQLIMATSNPQLSSIGMLGNGVDAARVERVYDRFVGVQINNESQSLGRWTAQQQVLEGVEIIFDESDGFGLSQAMSDYFNAWQELSMDPEGETQRQMVISKGEVLANTFQQKYSAVQSAQHGIDADIKGAVATINQLSAQIADLNRKIIDTETSGHTANEYRDQRDLALKELSGLIEISSFEDHSGAVKVSISGGRTLVDGVSHRSLTTRVNPTSGLLDVHLVSPDTSTIDITGSIDGGKVGGWLEARDITLQDYLTRLDDLADAIMQEVNGAHSAGRGLDESTGYDFFSGTDASDMQVNIDLVNDLNLIAASPDLAGVPGDGGNAVTIANLQHKTVLNGNTATFGEFYGTLVSDVGNEVLEVSAYYQHQSDMVTQLENYRESISGVSLDEEMVNLIKFQSAYDASAKLISIADELMQTVLGIV